MTVASGISLIVLISLISSAPAHSTPSQTSNSQEQQAFQKQLNGADAAEKRLDIDAWASLMRENCTPDATFAQFGQPPTDLSSEIAAERSQYSHIRHINLDSEHVVSMTFSGNSARAIVTYSLDTPGPSGQPDIRVSALISYNLVRINGKWLIKSVVIKPEPVLSRSATPKAA